MAITVPAVGDDATAGWAASVANALNAFGLVDHGVITGISFSAVSRVAGTLTYNVTFTVPPTVMLTVRAPAAYDVLPNLTSLPTTTDAGYVVFRNLGTDLTGYVDLHWFAIGS